MRILLGPKASVFTPSAASRETGGASGRSPISDILQMALVADDRCRGGEILRCVVVPSESYTRATRKPHGTIY